MFVGSQDVGEGNRRVQLPVNEDKYDCLALGLQWFDALVAEFDVLSAKKPGLTTYLFAPTSSWVGFVAGSPLAG